MRKRDPKSTAPTARAGGFPRTLYDTGLKKRRVVGLAILAILLTLFLIFNRIPKLDTVEADLAAAAGCNIAGSVTKKVSIIVVGVQNKNVLNGYEKSRKHRQAEALIAKGMNIEILSEDDFSELVGIEGTR